jgi:hypothetical protein
MSENKKQKKLARARQARTGETYSTALMHVRAGVQDGGTEPLAVGEPSPLMDEARAQLRELLAVNPELSWKGWHTVWSKDLGNGHYVTAETLAADRAEFLTDGGVRQFIAARAFLNVPNLARKTMNSSRSSYGLKHDVERWTRASDCNQYVSNGALIAAALALGLRASRETGSFNSVFNARAPTLRAAVERPVPPDVLRVLRAA